MQIGQVMGVEEGATVGEGFWGGFFGDLGEDVEGDCFGEDFEEDREDVEVVVVEVACFLRLGGICYVMSNE